MLGTIVNTLAVLAGGGLGLLFRKHIPQKIVEAVMTGLGLCTLYIGVSGTLKGQNALILILSVALGALIGEAIDIDRRVNRAAQSLEQRLRAKSAALPGAERPSLAEGFVTGSLLFCVGAMAILGSLQAGISSNCQTLFTKSLLDFSSAIVFGASLGPGVMLAAVPVLIYQGAITLLAQWLSPLLSDAVIAEMTCAGSLLIVAIGLNMLKISKIKVMNFLPAIFLPLLLCPLSDWFSRLFSA